MKDIYESEMKFGSFSEMDLFEIEKSQLLKKLGKGIKSVEFILLNSNTGGKAADITENLEG